MHNSKTEPIDIIAKQTPLFEEEKKAQKDQDSLNSQNKFV